MTTATEFINRIESLSGDPAAVVADCIAIYKHIKSTITGYDNAGKAAKAKIEEIILETGRSDWQTEAGRVYFPKPGVTIKYDAKALDALCASDDNLKRLLWPHRSEQERPGTMTIK